MFKDRTDGGVQLGRLLLGRVQGECLVLGLPRGGVITAEAVADVLHAPLGIAVARKVGHPRSPEYGVGAISESGDLVVDPRVDLPEEWVHAESERQLAEAKRRVELYTRGRERPSLQGKTVILVDDGIATGHTTEAAIRSVRRQNPLRLILAAPVAPPAVIERLRPLVDEIVVAQTPAEFYSVGQFYEDFRQVEDDEVIEALDRHSG